MSLQQKLYDLYLLDQQVRGLRSRLDAAQRRQTALTTKRDQLEQQKTELQQQIKHAQSRAASLEQESAGVDQKVDKLRQQMNTVRSNKEYSALLVEVNTLKQDKSKYDDQALEQMSEVETFQQRLSEIEQKATEQQKLVEQAGQEVERAREEVGGKLDELTAKRDAAAQEVPTEARQVFERQADNHDGEALAPVEEEDRRRMEYHCGGCFMNLPVERINSIMSKPDELTTCPNCGRILYLDENLKSALAPKT